MLLRGEVGGGKGLYTALLRGEVGGGMRMLREDAERGGTGGGTLDVGVVLKGEAGEEGEDDRGGGVMRGGTGGGLEELKGGVANWKVGGVP